MKSKICVKCSEVKVLPEFPKKKQRKDGYDTRCKKCVNLLNRERVVKKKEEKIDWPDIKTCNACKDEKPLEQFPVDASGKYGRKGRCSECCNQYQRSKYKYDDEWRNDKRDKQNIQQKERYQNDEEFRINKLEKTSIYKKTDKGAKVRREYEKNRYKNDPKYRLDHNVGAAVYSTLKSQGVCKAYRNAFNDILPYSIEELMSHLEAQFQTGMTWENYGGWHVDHIRAKCKFHYDSPDDPEFQKCWSLNNLQPLWARDNLSKGSS